MKGLNFQVKWYTNEVIRKGVSKEAEWVEGDGLEPWNFSILKYHPFAPQYQKISSNRSKTKKWELEMLRGTLCERPLFCESAGFTSEIIIKLELECLKIVISFAKISFSQWNSCNFPQKFIFTTKKRQFHWKFSVSPKVFWELGSQDPPLFPRLPNNKECFCI